MELDAHTLFKQLTCGATFSANHKTSHEATKNVIYLWKIFRSIFPDIFLIF